MLSKFLLPALATSLAHGEVIINEIAATDSGRLLRWDSNDQPYAGAGPAWWSPDFDSATWSTGNTPIGYSINPIATNLFSQLNNLSPSLYTRKTFTATSSQASSTRPLILRINFNDGFIAWLNGVEIARENMGAPKSHIFFDQVSYRTGSTSTTTKDFALGNAATFLTNGNNVLAIQVNNDSLAGNMRLDTALIIDEASGPDTFLISQGSSLQYLPGLHEPSSNLVEPATPTADPSDWIELHNNGPAAANLTGWTLSDSESQPTKWTFPSGTAIPAGGYLILLADAPANPIPGATYLHTNFQLNAGGDFLGLYNESGVAQSTIQPTFPKQYPNHSYGTDGLGGYAYHALPTPGKANSNAPLIARADAPDFDNKGGFYNSPVTVTITTKTPGATIRYTTNGTDPTLTNGLNYGAPLVLSTVTNRKGHVIRARAFKDGHITSSIKTHTFLIGQDPRLRTAPSLIYAGEPSRSLYDPFGIMALDGGTYVNSNWQATGPFDYNNSINRGRPYERPIHAEFYFPDGTVGFRSDLGIRVAASSYSRPRMTLTQTSASPWPANPVEKPSFNLYFRDEYGNPSVNIPLNGLDHPVKNYEHFRIRAGKNDILNPFIMDEFVRRLSRDMSGSATVGVINSLYVNAELKGFYNMVERLREPFFRELHRSEPGAQWDVLQFEGNDNIAEGDKIAWNDMINRLNTSTTLTNWNRVLDVADVTNMADYFLLNIFTATWDWPHNNWVAAKERSDAGRYRLYVWDAEGGMNNKGNRPVSQEMIQTYIASGTGELRDLWRGLNRWEEFRILFADRIHKHLFNGGILDDRDFNNSHISQEYDKLITEFSNLLSVMNGQTVTNSIPRLWASETAGRRRYLLGPIREEFRTNNLWPTTPPPNLSQLGGSVTNGYPLKLTSDIGDVVFTLDGTDPRLPGGTTNPAAITQPGSSQNLNILPLNSTWKYNDTNGDLGTAWHDPAFNDDAWLSGPGPLGFGIIRDNDTSIVYDIATTVNSTIPRQPTSYFRRTFDLQDAKNYLGLTLKIRSDAATVIYLNGHEIFRDSNLPAVSNYFTEPDSDASDNNEGDLDEYSIDPAFLIEGTNTLAVALHNNPGSSDMVFDLELDGQRTHPDNIPYPVTTPVRVMARTLQNGVWSALTTADFTVDSVPANSSNLAITEFLYNPIGANPAELNAGFDDGDLFEFLRVQNIGTTAIDLHQVRFTRGISFDFTNSKIRALPPGGAALIVVNLDAFRFRYGNTFDSIIAGQYTGKLANDGETLRLIGQNDALIHEFQYGTKTPWPDLTALDGHSLKIIDQHASHNLAANWRASDAVGGTPDGDLSFVTWQSRVFNPGQLANTALSGPEADPDGDGWSNFWEFALGTEPLDGTHFPPAFTTAIENDGPDQFLALSFTRAGGSRAVQFSTETSTNLDQWSNGGLRILPDTAHPDGSITSKFRHPAPLTNGKNFLRLKITN